VPTKAVGIQDTAVRTLRCGKVAAIVGTLDARPRATLENVRAHDAVLQGVVNKGATVAAVRFGQSFATDEDVRRDILERGARVSRVLQERDGYVEMRLLLRESPQPSPGPPTPVTPEIGPGRAYLERVRSARDESLRLGLRGALGPVVRAERAEELPKSRGVAFSHLIRRSDEDAYRDAVSALPALGEATIVGPLALYTFAESAI
jgi:hypothetical protein